MVTATKAKSQITAAIVNPILVSTNDVFETMLGCTPTRAGLSLKLSKFPPYELSAIIGMTGAANGTFVFSLPVSTAIALHNRMLGEQRTEIDADVRDTVGEITNMIAGGAKSKLENMKLTISIPNLISGIGHEIHYPSGIQPICLAFGTELGDFCMEAGFAPA